MDNDNNFSITGEDSDSVGLPLGLGMSLAKDMHALNNFSSLSDSEKKSVISYVQASTTGEDAKNRIANVVENLKSHNTNFTAF